MRNTLKKSLAIIVALALCLTAFMGCLSVSAEESTNTIVVEAVEVENGTATADVDITITSDGVYATTIDVSFAEGLTVAATDAVTATSYTPENALSVEYSFVDTDTIRIILDTVDNNITDNYTSIVLNVVFGITNATVAQTYAVTVDAVDAGSYAEGGVTLAATNGSVTVKEAVAECEHDWELVSAIPATETVDGTVTLDCTKCDEADGTVETVKYYQNYRAAYTNADCAAETSIVYSARKDRLAEQGDYEEAFIYLQHTLSSDNSNKITVMDVSEATDSEMGSSNRPCKSWSYGIRSMQMTEVVKSNVFVYVNDQWYNGLEVGYSIRSYVDERLSSSSDETEKTLLVNLLAYGEKMQILKSYNTDNLATSGLSEADAALITTTTPEITAEITDNHTDTSVYINKYLLDMAAKVEAVMYFRADKYTGENTSDFKVVATWKNANGVDKSVTVLKEDSEEECDLYYTSELLNGAVRDKRYTFSFAELSSYDLRQEVTFYIYDGETEVSGGYTASVEALIKNGIASGAYDDATVAVFHAVLNYCDASYAFFCK